MACGQLKWANPSWECSDCTSILRKYFVNLKITTILSITSFTVRNGIFNPFVLFLFFFIKVNVMAIQHRVVVLTGMNHMSTIS